MASNPVQPAEPDAGIIADAVLPPPAPPKGTRAAAIRKMAVRYPELSQGEIARRVGCSPQNVSEVLETFLAGTSLANLEDFRSNKPSILEAVQFRALASISQEKLDNQSALQLITGAAILQDKLQVLRGQPTSIHVHALVDVLDALRRRDQE